MRYHIVGIGGAGMSAVAHILLDQGHAVSGSDVRAGPATDALVARGATVHLGHDPAHGAGADAVLTTSAALPDHPELTAASARGAPVLKRADLWREWSREREVIAVAGTHGKTTTTAMIAMILQQAGRNPGFLIGGEVPDLGRSARWGDPRAPLVIEADEYDRAFLAIAPRVAVITNVEWDHVDIYPTPEAYDAAFRQFAASVADPRLLVLCGDDPGVGRAIPAPGATFYGVDESIAGDPVSCRIAPLDWTATGLRPNTEGTTFDLWHYSRRTFARRLLGPHRIRLHGDHNVRNALAATAAAALLDVPPAAVVEALAAYRGAGRRFELKGEADGVTVVDDYAHHPSEVRATIQAARARYGDRRLVVYLQPHTYSRTRALLDEWAGAFEGADAVRIGAVYAARERDTLGVDDELVAASIRHPDALPVGDVPHAASEIAALLRPGDVLLTLGAGDSDQIGPAILHALNVRRSTT